jgi:hypothetical protein
VAMAFVLDVERGGRERRGQSPPDFLDASAHGNTFLNGLTCTSR